MLFSGPAYQLDLVIPGISPASASLRKQRRQRRNLRKKARDRPQLLQRFTCRTLNFGLRKDLAMADLLAKFLLPLYLV